MILGLGCLGWSYCLLVPHQPIFPPSLCWKYWSGYIWLKLPKLPECGKSMVTNIQQKWYGISAFSPPNDLSSLSSTPPGVTVILDSLLFSTKFFEILRWNAVYYYYYCICHDLRPKGSHHALLTVYKNPLITIQMLLPLKHNSAAVYQQTVILQKHLLILYEEYCVPLQMHVSYHFQFLKGSVPGNFSCMQEDTRLCKTVISVKCICLAGILI